MIFTQALLAFWLLFLGSVLLALWIFLNSVLAQDDGTLVQLDKGRIRGVIRKSETGKDYYAFQEIPYAAPPVGANRYQLPKEPKAWNEILNTTRNTKICLQVESWDDYLEMSEDCLYINVYTPVKPGTSHNILPVLVYIHGGGFTSESGIYESKSPKYIMDHGVVVVSFNYRLGIFGFLGTDDGVIPKNLGLKDQRFAIEWVSKNIHLFGGNPDHVTLVGESAGGISVGLHLISQKPHENLFHAVIMQSGTPISNICKANNSDEQSFRMGRLLDSSFSSSNSTELLTILQKADALDILHLSNDSGIVGQVNIESEGLFSLLPYQAFIDKNYKKVPVIIGLTSEEILFLVSFKNETLLNEIDADSSLLVDKKANMSPVNRSTAGQLIKELYVGNNTFLNYYGGYIRYLSDKYFTTGLSKQVELSSDDAPYYFYQFAYKGPLGESMDLVPPPGAERVVHAEDLRYMWDGKTKGDLSQFPKADGLMLHRFVKMWTNFVKYFNPTPEEDPLLDNVIWPRSNPTTLRYLNMNVTFDIREQPRQYQQIKAILDKYMQPPFESYS